MVNQTGRNAIPIFRYAFPGCEALFAFDNASNHCYFALVASSMNLGVGKGQNKLREGLTLTGSCQPSRFGTRARHQLASRTRGSSPARHRLGADALDLPPALGSRTDFIVSLPLSASEIECARQSTVLLIGSFLFNFLYLLSHTCVEERGRHRDPQPDRGRGGEWGRWRGDGRERDAERGRDGGRGRVGRPETTNEDSRGVLTFRL